MNQAIKDHLMTTTIADTALPLHLFTVEEYHRMAEAGLFEGQRVELIYGKIVDMSPSKSTHASMIVKLTNILSKLLSNKYLLSVQNPLSYR
jgi:Uma2 family endonuclease